MLILGLVGVKTSGKTTVSNMIKNFFEDKSMPVVDTAFADKLKNTCAQVFDVPREFFDKQGHKERPFSRNFSPILTKEKIQKVLSLYNITNVDIDSLYAPVLNIRMGTPREIAVTVGTEVLRKIDKEIHLKNLFISPKSVNIVSDIRFKNEFDYVKNVLNGHVLYIKNDAAEAFVQENSHVSEKELFSFCQDCVLIDNNSDLKSLERQVVSLISGKCYV